MAESGWSKSKYSAWLDWVKPLRLQVTAWQLKKNLRLSSGYKRVVFSAESTALPQPRTAVTHVLLIRSFLTEVAALL